MLLPTRKLSIAGYISQQNHCISFVSHMRAALFWLNLLNPYFNFL